MKSFFVPVVLSIVLLSSSCSKNVSEFETIASCVNKRKELIVEKNNIDENTLKLLCCTYNYLIDDFGDGETYYCELLYNYRLTRNETRVGYDYFKYSVLLDEIFIVKDIDYKIVYNNINNGSYDGHNSIIYF